MNSRGNFNHSKRRKKQLHPNPSNTKKNDVFTFDECPAQNIFDTTRHNYEINTKLTWWWSSGEPITRNITQVRERLFKQGRICIFPEENERKILETYPVEDNRSEHSIQNPSAFCHFLASNKPIRRRLHCRPLTGLGRILDNPFEIHLTHSIHSPTPLQCRIFVKLTEIWCWQNEYEIIVNNLYKTSEKAQFERVEL